MTNDNPELVMYGRSSYCAYVALARDLLQRYKIPYREIDVLTDSTAAERLKAWTGYLSVPTLAVVQADDVTPLEPPAPLEPDQSVRGTDRGYLISEPNNQQLEDWLYKHGFRDKPYKR